MLNTYIYIHMKGQNLNYLNEKRSFKLNY